jgi:IS30 family transposase
LLVKTNQGENMLTNRITRTKRKTIITLRDKNLSHQAIAEHIGCHRNTVGRILREEGMT